MENLKGTLFDKGEKIGEIAYYDFYLTQSRATFRTSVALTVNKRYILKLENGTGVKVAPTSLPKIASADMLIHVSVMDENAPDPEPAPPKTDPKTEPAPRKTEPKTEPTPPKTELNTEPKIGPKPEEPKT